MSSIIILGEEDNVAIATRTLKVGEEGAVNSIPKGHKIALENIKQGDAIIKYSQLIGYAANDIDKGSLVHLENLEFRNVDHSYEFCSEFREAAINDKKDSFQGYLRDNGRVGTRNTIAILSSVNCSATAARLVANHFNEQVLEKYTNVDGVVAYVHGTGCGMADSLGKGLKRFNGLCGVTQEIQI